MVNSFKENDIVKANTSISSKIPKGTIGTILCVFDDGKEYLVEFVNEEGETLEDIIPTVKQEDLEHY